MSAYWLTIREFLTSKKFIVAVAGVVITLAAKHGLNLDPETTQHIVYIIVAYLVGQGIADHGKEAAKVDGTMTIATSDAIIDPPRPVKDKLI